MTTETRDYLPAPETSFPGNIGLLRAGLKFGHLRLLALVEDFGSVTRAATALNMSQPAASRLLSEMEKIVGSPLFERLPRGVVLTRIGEALARRARSVMLEIREAAREIEDLKTGYGGTVSLGAVTAPAIALASPAIQRASAAYPGIDINVTIETSNLLTRNLLAAHYDFVIGRIPDDLDSRLFRARQIGVERACLIVRSGHPLANGAPVGLQALSDCSWVFQPQGSLLRRAVEMLFMANGVSMPGRTVNTQSILMTMALVSQSDAVAPVAREVAEFIASRTAVAGRIMILETDFELTAEPYSIITAAGRDLPPSAQLLHDMILEAAKSSSMHAI